MEVDIVKEPNMIIEKFFQFVCLVYQIDNKFNCWVRSETDIFKVLTFNDDLANIALLVRLFSQ